MLASRLPVGRPQAVRPGVPVALGQVSTACPGQVPELKARGLVPEIQAVPVVLVVPELAA